MAKKRRIRCLKPFYCLEIHTEGMVSFCCPEWSRVKYIGNIRESSLEEIWNNEKAQFIRDKMYFGEVDEVCREDMCPHLYRSRYIEVNKYNKFLTDPHVKEITEGKTFLAAKPTRINLSNWHKCNLKCVMCGCWRNIYKGRNDRTKVITELKKKKIEIEKGKEAKLANKAYREVRRLLPFLKAMRLTGAGEPLLRDDTLKILRQKNKPRRLEIELATNGLLLTPKIWREIEHNKFTCIDVSIDAASKSTYEKIRRGGNWDVLMKNLNFISRLKKRREIERFILNFVVMKSNYNEIKAFVKLGRRLGCDSLFFQRVRGDILDGENIFSSNNRRALQKLGNIKKEALSLNKPGCTVHFGNI